MEYDIISYLRAGRIYIGMNRDEIEKVCSNKPKRFLKSRYDEYESDSYPDFFIYYKSPGVCDAIEFHKPAAVTFSGISLLDEPYEKVKESLKRLDSAMEIDGDGLTSYKLGIGMYAPYAGDDPTYKAEGVIVFERGYYD